jgi:small redox-active disulfide protein 2
MKIEVLGSGCAKCQKVAKAIEDVLNKEGKEAELIKVTDINEITDRGIMMTPAVMIDGKLVSQGKVPNEEEIKNWL